MNNCCCFVFGFSYILNSQGIKYVFAIEFINSEQILKLIRTVMDFHGWILLL